MQSDVWCLFTCIDDDDSSCIAGTTGTSSTTESKYLEYNPGSELNLFFWTMNNEQWKAKESNEKQKSNKR